MVSVFMVPAAPSSPATVMAMASAAPAAPLWNTERATSAQPPVVQAFALRPVAATAATGITYVAATSSTAHNMARG